MPSASIGIKLNAVTGAANKEPVENALDIAAKAMLCSAYGFDTKHFPLSILSKLKMIVSLDFFSFLLLIFLFFLF